MGSKLMIVFPGTGYTCKERLLVECAAQYERAGYQVNRLDFSMIPFKKIETVDEAVKCANEQVLLQTKDVDFDRYSDIVFLSKSLGTVCAGWLESQLHVHPRQLYLTPIQQTLNYVHEDSCVIAMVIGTQDHNMTADCLNEYCIERGIHCVVIDGVGHKLKSNDEAKTERINQQILSLCDVR